MRVHMSTTVDRSCRRELTYCVHVALHAEAGAVQTADCSFHPIKTGVSLVLYSYRYASVTSTSKYRQKGSGYGPSPHAYVRMSMYYVPSLLPGPPESRVLLSAMSTIMYGCTQ